MSTSAQPNAVEARYREEFATVAERDKVTERARLNESWLRARQHHRNNDHCHRNEERQARQPAGSFDKRPLPCCSSGFRYGRDLADLWPEEKIMQKGGQEEACHKSQFHNQDLRPRSWIGEGNLSL